METTLAGFGLPATTSPLLARMQCMMPSAHWNFLGHPSGVTGEQACHQLDDERRAEEIEAWLPDGCYTQWLAPGLRKRPGGSIGSTCRDVSDSATHFGKEVGSERLAGTGAPFGVPDE